MKKYIVIGGILTGILGGLTGNAQVNVIFKNDSQFGMKLYLGGNAYIDSIPSHSQTVHLRFSKISDKEKLSLVAQNGIYSLNGNATGTTYTQGSYTYTIVWDNKKKIYSAILKPL